MPNLPQKLDNDKQPNTLSYTDGEVNWLLDKIARLQKANQFLGRKYQKVIKICKALRAENAHLQTANKTQVERLEQLQSTHFLPKP